MLKFVSAFLCQFDCISFAQISETTTVCENEQSYFCTASDRYAGLRQVF